MMHVEQSMMVWHCDGMMRSICWCLLSCYCLRQHACTVLSMLTKLSEIHYTISDIVPVTTSEEVWVHFFTSIQMETKFTFTLCTNVYHQQDLGQIRFLMQCSASWLLLLRTYKMVGILFCVVSSSIMIWIRQDLFTRRVVFDSVLPLFQNASSNSFLFMLAFLV